MDIAHTMVIMTYGAKEQEDVISNTDESQTGLPWTQQEHDEPAAESSCQGQDLVASISSLLEQYQNALIQHVEAEVKAKTLSVVGEESKLLRSQARGWVVSIESEMQRIRETVLSGARQHMFERIREEMDSVLEDLDIRLRQKLLEVPSSSEQLELAAGWVREGAAREAAASPVWENTAETVQSEGWEANPRQSPEIHQHQVILKIEPPLQLLSLLHFYRSLREMQDVSIVRSQGSADGGVVMELRLTEPNALYKILRDISGVNEIGDDIPEAGGNNYRALRVALKTADVWRNDKHDQP